MIIQSPVLTTKSHASGKSKNSYFRILKKGSGVFFGIGADSKFDGRCASRIFSKFFSPAPENALAHGARGLVGYQPTNSESPHMTYDYIK